MEDIPKPWCCSSSSCSSGGGGRRRRTERRTSRPSKWSNPRRDILEIITSRFETRREIIRLRAVCKSWRSKIPFPPNDSTLVAKEYFLKYVGLSQEENENGTTSEVNKSVSKEIKKVVVGENKDGEIVVMMLHFSGELKAWKMDSMGATSKVEYSSSLEVSKVAPPAFNYRVSHRFGPRKAYLVSSFGDLFMVKYIGGSVSELPPLDVFKLDEEHGLWVAVQDLEKDRVFFIGDGCSYSVSAKEFEGCKVNCVYFTDESDFYSGVEENYPGLNASLYDLVEDVSRPLTSVVGYSRIFWPPPTWLNQTPSGK
ncbi:hypothetical protein FNV43_RR06302 [Rhamnella rubrinervis]|uniref:KIB1-4 beta-propeller domain-containing protein n=1 Tax=Rhamnella rubrinervis TaxID=2594499 RepID=A0A8K0HCT6_9ROSA|nr:hypothetical protein FNV43_RR06302 [Rhamnella rubrinervis]